jgi:COP9 signalosome complex subunit 7
MELGSHLSAKLEPFVLMAKSAKGAAAAKLILDAISAQGVYFFAELLDAPNIKEVRVSRSGCPASCRNGSHAARSQLASSEQHRAHYALLEICTYKTYQDYLSTTPSRSACVDI